MVRRLAEQGLITHERYRGVRLTGDGRRAALRTLRRHRIIECYLTEVLGYPWDRVHDEAERLEHAASDELVDRMAAALGDPVHDPHGAPIPTRDGRVEEIGAADARRSGAAASGCACAACRTRNPSGCATSPSSAFAPARWCASWTRRRSMAPSRSGWTRPAGGVARGRGGARRAGVHRERPRRLTPDPSGNASCPGSPRDRAAFRGDLEERVTARPIVTDPDTGIPDLIRRLTRRFEAAGDGRGAAGEARDEGEPPPATRGVLWMALAFGAGVVMLVALTILLATLLGRLDERPHVVRRPRHGHRGAGPRGLAREARARERTRSPRTRSPDARIAERHRALVRVGAPLTARLGESHARRRGTGAARRAFRLSSRDHSRRVPAAARPRRHPARAGDARRIAIDERLAADAGLRSATGSSSRATPAAAGDTVVVAAIVRRRADPTEIARGEYRVRLHLDQLQSLLGYGDRVDRFAVATRSAGAATDAIGAHQRRRVRLSRPPLGATSRWRRPRTFAVVTRFHRAIGVITIVASAIFLLCIMLLKVDERRRDVAALRLMGISRADDRAQRRARGVGRRGARQHRGRRGRRARVGDRELALPGRVPHAAALRPRHAATSSCSRSRSRSCSASSPAGSRRGGSCARRRSTLFGR